MVGFFRSSKQLAFLSLPMTWHTKNASMRAEVSTSIASGAGGGGGNGRSNRAGWGPPWLAVDGIIVDQVDA